VFGRSAGDRVDVGEHAVEARLDPLLDRLPNVLLYPL
jgi:hypothetical protein